MNLAAIGKVIAVEPIEGADFIRKATVVCGQAGKWICVVGSDISNGELVTVFLQDAILPPDERWAFMEKHHWRVRMARFKGVPSECVIIKGAPDMPVGTDLTQALGVTKHTKPLPESMMGEALGNFPGFIPRTDEPNFQTVPELVARMNEPWVATLKCDGSSATAWHDDEGVLHVASRNLDLREFSKSGAGNAYWRVARKYEMGFLLSGCALQFEIVGPGIQGNPMGLPEIEGRAFTLYNYANHRKMPAADLEYVAGRIGMPTAPILFGGSSVLSDDELRKAAEVKYPNGKHGEGIVIRAETHEWSFKVINLLYKK